MIQFEVHSVVDGGTIVGRELNTPGHLEFHELHNRLHEDMEATCHLRQNVTRPVKGKFYIGASHRKHKCWCRVRAEDTDTAAAGVFTRCHFVDLGGSEKINCKHIYLMDDTYKTVPHQSQTYKLFNLTPLIAQTCYDEMTTKIEKSDRWAASAETFVDKQLKASSRVEIEVVERTPNGTYINLYLHNSVGTSPSSSKVSGTMTCLNKLLVHKTYAEFTVDPEILANTQSSFSDNPPVTSQTDTHSAAASGTTDSTQGIRQPAPAAALPLIMQQQASPRQQQPAPVYDPQGNLVPPLNEDIATTAAILRKELGIPEAEPTGVATHARSCTDKPTHTAPERAATTTAVKNNATEIKQRTYVSPQNLLPDPDPSVNIIVSHEDEILVDYIHAKKQTINNVMELHLDRNVMAAMMSQDCQTPQWVQGYAWSAVWDCTPTVAITPHGTIYTYLPILISGLMDSNQLQRGRTEMSTPSLVILCSSIIQAEHINDHAQRLCSKLKYIKCLLIHGGSSETEKQVELINGCSILITTPHCLLRCLSSRITSLCRMKHLVIHGANLIEDYNAEVVRLMEIGQSSMYNGRAMFQTVVVAKRVSPGLYGFIHTHIRDPYVVIADKTEAAVYGQVKHTVTYTEDKWTVLVSFLRDDPVVKDKRILIVAKDDGVVTAVRRMLADTQSYHVISCFGSDDGAKIRETYKHFTASQHSKPMLVCTDEALQKLNITTVDILIHYDLPKTKTQLSNRLWSMSKHFVLRNQLDLKLKSDMELSQCSAACVSLMLLGQADQEWMPQLVKHLERTHSTIPEEVKQLAKEQQLAVEARKVKRLCDNVVAFGHCRNDFYCSYRHVISEELDLNNKRFLELPTKGYVKMKVLHVATASQYYARLLEHRYSDEAAKMYSGYSVLTMQMAQFSSNTYELDQIFLPVLGELYAVRDENRPDDKTYYRVECIELSKPNYMNHIERVRVRRIDVGDCFVVLTALLVPLPAHLKAIPYQAIEVVGCRIKPWDNDEIWPKQSDSYVHDAIHNEVIEGNITLSIGNTLWLDPVIKKHYLPATNTLVVKFSLRRDLLQSKMAVQNDQHLNLLYSLCKGKIDAPSVDSPDIVFNSSGVPVPLHTQTLQPKIYDVTTKHTFVILSSVTDKCTLFLQNTDAQHRLDAFHESLQSDLSSMFELSGEIINGSLVAARHNVSGGKTTDKDDWFRAKVLFCWEDDTYHVRFIDYGDEDVVTRSQIRLLPRAHTLLPAQAIECQLADMDYGMSAEQLLAVADDIYDAAHDQQVEEQTNKPATGEQATPATGETDAQATDLQDDTDTTQDDCNTRPYCRSFTIQIIKEECAELLGSTRYVVDLIDASLKYKVSLTQRLLEKGNMKYNEQRAQDKYMHPEQPLTDQRCIDLCTLCVVIICDQGTASQLTVIQDLNKATKDLLNAPTLPEDREMDHLIYCISDLVGHVHHKDNLCALLETILAILDKHVRYRLCDYVPDTDKHSATTERLCHAMCYHLSKNSSSKTLKQLIKVTELLVGNKKYVVGIIEAGLLSAISARIADATAVITAADAAATDTKVAVSEAKASKKSLIIFLRKTLTALHHVFHPKLVKEGCIATLCNELKLTDQLINLQIIIAFNSVTSTQQVRAEIRKHGGLSSVLPILNKTTNVILHKECITLLLSMADGNKDLLVSLKTEEIITQFKKTLHAEDALNTMCEQILSKLQKKPVLIVQPTATVIQPAAAKSAPVRLGTPYVADGPTRKAHPRCMYAQDKYNILLSVEIRDLEDRGRNLTCDFTTKSVKFRSTVDNTQYVLDIELYELITITECTYKIRLNQCYIGLRKKSFYRWPRLTKQKKLPAYITLDAERTFEVDSDDAEGFNVKLKKKTVAPDVLSLICKQVLPQSLIFGDRNSTTNKTISSKDYELPSTDTETETSHTEGDESDLAWSEHEHWD